MNRKVVSTLHYLLTLSHPYKLMSAFFFIFKIEISYMITSINKFTNWILNDAILSASEGDDLTVSNNFLINFRNETFHVSQSDQVLFSILSVNAQL